jgi:hypothetical protein
MSVARQMFAPSTQSRVTKIVIDATQPLPTTDQTIAYQQISGVDLAELDPNDQFNTIGRNTRRRPRL